MGERQGRDGRGESRDGREGRGGARRDGARGPSSAGGQGGQGGRGRPGSPARSPRSAPRGGASEERKPQGVRAIGVDRPRIQAPLLPEGVDGSGLDGDVKAELRSLTKASADEVGAHLAAAALLLDEDPEAAYAHANYARARASRVGSVREAAGLAAYLTGRYSEALSELRAVRRIHGTDVHLPVMADCQRGLGRPERALEMAGSPEAAALPVAGQVEMRIVAAGARQDLGQPDAAVLTLRCPQLNDAKAEWAPRLRYAYAEALLAAGRADEGREWMAKAAAVDVDGTTDAAERLAELEGVSFLDIGDDEPGAADPV